MDWEQQARALAALAGLRVGLNRRGEWYAVLDDIEIGDGHILASAVSHGGGSLSSAIMRLWAVVVDELKPNEMLVKHATDKERRRAFRWNGFMWADVVEAE